MVSLFLTIPKTKPDGIALSLTPPSSLSLSSSSTATTTNTNTYANTNANVNVNVNAYVNPTIITNHQILQAKNRGRIQIANDIFITVHPSHRNAPKEEKLPIHALITLIVPAATLLSALIAFRVSGAQGWEAIFPSQATCPIVLKLTVWISLVGVVAYQQSFYHYSFGGKNLALEGDFSVNYIGVEVIVDDGFFAAQLVMAGGEEDLEPGQGQGQRQTVVRAEEEHGTVDINVDGIDVDQCMEDPSQDLLSRANKGKEGSIIGSGSSTAVVSSVTHATTAPSVFAPLPKNSSNLDPPDATGNTGNGKSPVDASSPRALASSLPPSAKTTASPASTAATSPQKAAPGSIPFRFIRATKGDVAAAKERWADTCTWREENNMDACLTVPHPSLKTIKMHYPHYFHLRGKNNECCYYEQPPKMNLPELKKNGINIEKLIKHYSICCEYMWTKIEDSEEGKSIYVIDLAGIGFRDFAGEVVDFVKRASAFTGAHYPERSGTIFVVNVPSWFSVIWNVVKPMVDDVTKQKIKILRYGQEAIMQALMEKIDIQNIPPEYGGKSMPLGQSPEELAFMKHFEKLNNTQ